jgi:hypothetical protein
MFIREGRKYPSPRLLANKLEGVLVITLLSPFSFHPRTIEESPELAGVIFYNLYQIPINAAIFAGCFPL